MRKLTFKLVLALALILTVGLQAGTPARASGGAYTSDSVVVLSFTRFVPCAAGGAGEVLVVSGNIHTLFHITIDANGGVSMNLVHNPQNVTGTGETTGTIYHGTGVTRTQSNTRVGEQSNFVNNFRLISEGPGGNYMIHENYHVTVNPDGTVTAFVDNFSFTCN
jgi:hypothetical protein